MICIKKRVIRNEIAVLCKLLDNGMTPLFYRNRASVLDLRADVAVFDSRIGKTDIAVKLRKIRRSLLHPFYLPGDLLAHGGEKLVFKCRKPVGSTEDHGLFLLQLLGYESFGVRKGLFSYVPVGHLRQEGLCDLDIVSENTVV